MSKIPLITREKEGDKKPTRYYSKKQEDAIAKATGGKRNANSGATMWVKGDISLTQWLLEAKTRTSHCDSMSIKKEWISKNRKEALFAGKPYSAIVFNFGPDEENHYIIDEELFLELVNYLKEKTHD